MKDIMSAHTVRRQPNMAVQKQPSPCAGTPVQTVERWLLLDKVKLLRHVFKLTDRDITALQAHLSILPKGEIGVGDLNISYMKV